MSLSVFLNDVQQVELEKFSTYVGDSISNIVRLSLMEYGAITEGLKNPRKEINYPGVKFYEVPKDEGISNIVNIICDVMDVSDKLLYCTRRHKKHIIAKHALRYWIHKYFQFSLKVVGKLTCNVDHSTIVHSIKTWDDLCDTDKKYKSFNQQIESKLYA